MASYVTHLECVSCGRRYEPSPDLYVCPECGIKGILDVKYDYDALGERLSREAFGQNPDRSQWRYFDLLPLSRRDTVQNLQVGWTPLYHAGRLADHLGFPGLYIKDDGRNPTGSFKDRASAVGVARALEIGARVVACASTGNAASSMAGFSAAAGLPSYIFVPATAPEAKVTQLLVYGANVLLVDGTYDQAYYLCNDACDRWGWYNRNCAINPYLMEGKKTAGWEIAEQFGWDPPEWVFMAVGDGCSIAGVWKAFAEAKRLGLIERTPRMVGVQSQGARPLVDSFETGQELVPVRPDTLADSIAVGEPRNSTKALSAVRDSGGRMVAVPDADIVAAIHEVARFTGVFAEPAGATAYAGFKKLLAEGVVGANDRVLVLITGNGLKDIKSARQAVGDGRTIQPDLEQLAAIVEGGAQAR